MNSFARSILAQRVRIPDRGVMTVTTLRAPVGPRHTTTTTIPSSQSHGRFFHASSPVAFPVRRRKRPTTSNSAAAGMGQDADDNRAAENNNPLKHVAVDDDEDFILGANALLDKLQASVESMKAQNDTFVVERFFSDLGEVLTIDLGPKEGKYRIEMSLEDHVFEYSSPISGKILYILSAHSGEWVGMEDGHLFEGIFVRDLIRQCQGLPNL